MPTISSNELRAHLAATLREVEASQEPVVISRRGRAVSVLMSYSQYEQLGKSPFSLAAAIDEWRGKYAPAQDEPDDKPFADARGASPGRRFDRPQ